MNIDHDKRGHPRAMLVSASLAETPGPDGTYFTVFCPIAEILKLKDTDRILTGHPWLDVPDSEIIAQQLSRRDHMRVKSFLAAGHYIAISATAIRGKRSKGCRLDANGDLIVRYQYTPRNPKRYLSDLDIFWLRQMSEESYRYSGALYLVQAIAEYFQRLGDKLADAPKPKRVKKKKVKAKYRRAKEQA